MSVPVIQSFHLANRLSVGFLALTAGVVGLTTGTVTILLTYFSLCAEDYRCAN